MSEFSCPVVEVPGFGRHKNADTLCITQVEGCTCIFKEGGFKKGDLAVFIPVDALVPLDHPAFSWLKDPKKPNQTHHRVKARRLRGVFSDGFLIPMSDVGTPTKAVTVGPVGCYLEPLTVMLGMDLAAWLGVTKAEDKAPAIMNGDAEYGPDGAPVYDVEPLKKYKYLFEDPNEEVVVTEKIHGTNSRFCYAEGRLWVGSRNQFLRSDERNLWWRIAKDHDLEAKLQKLPGVVLFGETYGDVQDLKYGCASGERKVAFFDAYDLKERRYLHFPEFHALCTALALPMVPILYTGPYLSFDHIARMVDPPEGAAPYESWYKGCLREGVVVKPLTERWNNATHRTILKLVSQAYLLRKGGTELH